MKNSICHQCKFARKTWSAELEKDGYVGCALPVIKERQGIQRDLEYSFITEGEMIGEGWVDLRAKPFSESSGKLSNMQLITLGIKQCREFESDIDE